MRSFLPRLSRAFARRAFPFFERAFDLHITPNDYYSPIPSVKDLPPEVYESVFSMQGVDMNEAGQKEILDDVFPSYLAEYQPQKNGGLSLVDAFALYALLRDRKPKRMVEIGGRDWTEGGTQFWNESYMLHTFLMYNTSFRVLWAARWFKQTHPDLLAQRFSYLEPGHRLTSFWIERLA